MQVGERLKLYRDSHGLTQQDVAALIGCSGASVCKWEAGYPMLGVSVLALETVLSIDTPRAVLEKVRQGAGTAVEQELARVMAENAALRQAGENMRRDNDNLRARVVRAETKLTEVEQWVSRAPI